MRAVIATVAGGPEVLSVADMPDPEPGPDQVLVRLAAAGVNFIDTYRRSGTYRMPFPHVVGSEGAGVVERVGRDVTTIQPGERVAWSAAPGSYAELVAVPVSAALVVPDGVPDDVAAALPLQGLTAHYLVTSSFRVEPGVTVLVHAGAGGVGLLLVQMAAARGARVITTVGSAEKETLARRAGASEVIRYRELANLTDELPALVRDLTDGRGVEAVYDSVGRDTFDASLASLARRGTLVLFGASSGAVPPFDPQRLNAAGSVFLTRPTLGDHTRDRAELDWRASEVFGAVQDGSLDVRIGATYPLADAAEAHRALESRSTTGKVLLIP
ncbi:quinone oxidoreductase family protein [Cellulomonas edaphi]|uniref:Quinone oxidoreductase n=1 Tax=Cellulomonas edaphi TaxID=3053468 RepID=A0ABT7S8V8_9CELL|nr:quinone oxidoreductase [Cellulomons edaphi]MDM7831969.1 quinone oxidoreductase [Cellulomons edaphi]